MLTRPSRPSFPGVLYGFSQVLACLSIVPGTPYIFRLVSVIAVAGITFYAIFYTTTGDLGGDLGVGSAILVQLLTQIDFALLTDPDTLHDYSTSNTTDDDLKVTQKPLKDRLIWAFRLYTNQRGIDWKHQPKNLPPRPSPSTPRLTFVLQRLKTAIICACIEGCLVVLNASNPGLTTPGKVLTDATPIWRALGCAGFGIAGYLRINALHCVLSALVVGLGMSTPERWPNLFGTFYDACSVQNFWRRVWHQLLRRPITTFTNLILKHIFRITLPSPLSPTSASASALLPLKTKLLRLYIAFTLVGLIHVGGEYMLISQWGWGAFVFFLLQAVGITVEVVILYCYRALTGQTADASISLSGSGRGERRISGKTKKWVRVPVRAQAQDGNHDAGSFNGEGGDGNGHGNGEGEEFSFAKVVGWLWVGWWMTFSAAYMINPLVPVGFFVDPKWDLRNEEGVARGVG